MVEAQGHITNRLYPAFPIDSNNQVQKCYWRSFMDYHPDQQIAVLATQNSNVIEIYNLKDQTRQLIVPDRIQVKMSYDEMNPYLVGYEDIKITDRYIYALYNGMTFEERMREEESGKRLDGANRIYVFDHKGKPVIEYTLDRYLVGIDVDEEKGLIYGTDVNKADFLCCFKK